MLSWLVVRTTSITFEFYFLGFKGKTLCLADVHENKKSVAGAESSPSILLPFIYYSAVDRFAGLELKASVMVLPFVRGEKPRAQLCWGRRRVQQGGNEV